MVSLVGDETCHVGMTQLRYPGGTAAVPNPSILVREPLRTFALKALPAQLWGLGAPGGRSSASQTQCSHVWATCRAQAPSDCAAVEQRRRPRGGLNYHHPLASRGIARPITKAHRCLARLTVVWSCARPCVLRIRMPPMWRRNVAMSASAVSVMLSSTTTSSSALSHSCRCRSAGQAP